MLKQMIKKKIIIFFIVFTWAKDIQIINGYEYAQPKGLTFLSSFPSDLYNYRKQTFIKEKINEWLVISAITGIMIVYDEPLIVEAQKIGATILLNSLRFLTNPYASPQIWALHYILLEMEYST